MPSGSNVTSIAKQLEDFILSAFSACRPFMSNDFVLKKFQKDPRDSIKI